MSYSEHRRQNLAEQERHEQRVRQEIYEAERERAQAYAPLATPSDAHREWHTNSGVPMGMPGCPQDACHVPDFPMPEEVEQGSPGAVKCGNRKVHGQQATYHLGISGVQECFAAEAEAEAWFGQPQFKAYRERLAAEQAEREAEPAKPRVDWNTIPVGGAGFGYYALTAPDGKVHFYRVERPTKGKWAGRTFIMEQAGDEFFKIEPRQRCYALLTMIAEDPDEAGHLYADTLERCTRCGRTLTDAVSRAAAMGPDCRKKAGL